MKRVRRNIFNNSIAKGNSYLKSFSGAKVRHLDHLTELTLSKDKLTMFIFYFGSNEITHRNLEDINCNTNFDEVISISICDVWC